MGTDLLGVWVRVQGFLRFQICIQNSHRFARHCSYHGAACMRCKEAQDLRPTHHNASSHHAMVVACSSTIKTLSTSYNSVIYPEIQPVEGNPQKYREALISCEQLNTFQMLRKYRKAVSNGCILDPECIVELSQQGSHTNPYAESTCINIITPSGMGSSVIPQQRQCTHRCQPAPWDPIGATRIRTELTRSARRPIRFMNEMLQPNKING